MFLDFSKIVKTQCANTVNCGYAQFLIIRKLYNNRQEFSLAGTTVYKAGYSKLED